MIATLFSSFSVNALSSDRKSLEVVMGRTKQALPDATPPGNRRPDDRVCMSAPRRILPAKAMISDSEIKFPLFFFFKFFSKSKLTHDKIL